MKASHGGGLSLQSSAQPPCPLLLHEHPSLTTQHRASCTHPRHKWRLHELLYFVFVSSHGALFSLALSFPAAGLVRATSSSTVTPTCLLHQLELNSLAPCKLATGDVSVFYFSTASSLSLSYSRLVSEELQSILHLSTLEPSASEVVTAFKIRKNS